MRLGMYPLRRPTVGDGMRLAIADPPYLGRAALWYGGKGRSHQGTSGRAVGRGDLAREFHPDAHLWDDPASHTGLMMDMDAAYDGWALAASGKTLGCIHADADALGARVAIWHVTNAIPDGARVRSTWEAVIYRVPAERRAVGTGHRVPDLLSAAHPVSGFVGAKPPEWTRWVLAMLGYDPASDEVVDLFPGSGAVSAQAAMLL